MSVSGPIDRRILRSCATLSALVFLFVSPNIAQCECGNYVIVVRNSDGGATIPDHSPAPAGPICHGPGCSSAPTHAIPIPAPTPVNRPSPDLTTNALRPDPDPPGEVQAMPSLRIARSISPSDIFHPPAQSESRRFGALEFATRGRTGAVTPFTSGTIARCRGRLVGPSWAGERIHSSRGSCHGPAPSCLHAHRTAGGHRHHRHPDRPATPRRAEGPRGGQPDEVHEQPQADRPGRPQPPRHLASSSPPARGRLRSHRSRGRRLRPVVGPQPSCPTSSRTTLHRAINFAFPPETPGHGRVRPTSCRPTRTPAGRTPPPAGRAWSPSSARPTRPRPRATGRARTTTTPTRGHPSSATCPSPSQHHRPEREPNGPFYYLSKWKWLRSSTG